MAELRHIVVFEGPFCSFSNCEFFVFGLALESIFTISWNVTLSFFNLLAFSKI